MQITRVLVVLVCIAASVSAFGQVQSAKGRATVTYTGVATPEVGSSAPERPVQGDGDALRRGGRSRIRKL